MDNNIYDDSNNGTSGDSIRGKFRDRIFNIKLVRYSKKSLGSKMVSLILFNKAKNSLISMIRNDSRDRFVRSVIRKIKETSGDRGYVRIVGVSNRKKKDNKKNITKEQLKVKIVREIKKDIEKKYAELEVLETELELVKDKSNSDKELVRVKNLKMELDILRRKIDNVVSEYNIYDDYNIIVSDDIYSSDIMDDIIKYRDLVDNMDDSNLLDIYRDFYIKLVGVSDKVSDLVEDNKDIGNDLDYDDYGYYKLKNEVVMLDNKLSDCDYYIDKQNEYIKKLMDRVNDIDRVEYSTYKFRGLNEFVSASLRYVSLLMVSPLQGLIPSIAINTLVTRKIMKKLYNDIRIDKVDKVRYEAVNYDFEIRNRLNDLDYTYDMVDDTIKMIDNIREDIIKSYVNVSGVGDTLGKLDDIKDKVVNNKYKMDIVKKKLVASKKINDNKLKKVKELNNN